MSRHSPRFRMLAELGFLCLVEALPNILKWGDSRIFEVSTVPLLLYLIVNRAWLPNVPRLVWVLSAVHLLGTAGVLESDFSTDFFFPLNASVHCLCVLGVFAHKYYHLRDFRRVAVCAFILIGFAIQISIMRNDVQLMIEGGMRKGTNLIGWFGAVQCAFVFALPGPWRFLAILPLGVIIRSGCRSALGAVIIQFAIVHFLSRDRKLERDRLVMTFFLIATLFAGAMAFESLLTTLPKTMQPMGGWARMVNSGQAASNRAIPLYGWLVFLIQHPSFTGHGINTYGIRYFVGEWPHNGILHVFNGYGVISGFLYLWFCLGYLKTLWRTRLPLPEQVVWGIGFMCAILFRGMIECTIVGESLHAIGVLATYGVGAGLYAALDAKSRGTQAGWLRPEQILGPRHL